MPGVFEGTLFSFFYLYGVAAISLPLSHRLFARSGLLLRWLAALVFAATFLTLSFQVLLAMTLFNRHAAAAVLALAVVAMHFAGLGHASLRDAILRDVAVCARWMARVQSRPVQAFYASVLLAFAVTIARSLMLPTVGWDSITYHYVKAGMWVQSGGPITLDAPGGWSMYRAIFGGGEIFTAWSMLPFHNDLLAGAVDVVWWLCCGLALVAIAREFGIRARHRVLIACYAVFLPAAWDAVGWGYVDLTNTAFQLVGLVFGIRALRTRHAPALLVSLLSLGLAANVKLTAVPFAVAAGVLLLLDVLRRAEGRASRMAMLALGVLASVLFLAPWLANNFLDTGYLLRFPMSVAGIQLGAENAAFGWSQARDLPAFALGAEIAALGRVFPAPTVNESHLSALTLPMLALALVGFLRIMWTRRDLRGAQALVFFLGGSVLLAYFNPAFSYTRLGFTWVNGRFLLPLVCAALPFAIAALPQRGRARDYVSWSFAGALLVHFACFLPVRFAKPEPALIVTGTLLLLVGTVTLCALLRRALRNDSPAWAGATLGLVLVSFVYVIALDRLHEVDRRYLLLGQRNVSADVFRYWWQSAHLAESEAEQHRIAVTAGPRQDADNWLMYYFLGRNLQSTLHYVPISKDGEIIPFGPDERRKEQGDYVTWLSRLNEAQISHVFSFFPNSLELSWMDADPERFERLNGDGEHWAFFRVRDHKDQLGAPTVR